MFRSLSTIVPFLVISCTTLACAGRGGGARHVEARNPGEFSKVVSNGPYDVQVRIGADPAVEVECGGEGASHVRTRIEDGTLVIERDRSGSWFGVASDKCTVSVTLPKLVSVAVSGSGDLSVDGKGDGLARISASGSGDVRVDSAHADQFELDASGSGNVSIRDLTADDVHARVSGSGDVLTSGRAKVFVVESNGSGDVKARSLKTEESRVRSNGSANVHLFASRKVDVQSNGSGDVFVVGQPAEKACAVQGSGRVRWE
jgi:hypothetical protein